MSLASPPKAASPSSSSPRLTIEHWPTLRPSAIAFLEQAAGPLPAPVRSDLFGLDRFHQHGVSLAQAQPVERRKGRRRPRTPPFFPRLADNLRMLKRVRDYLDSLDGEGDALSPAAEWLLDNFHLIEAQVPEIRTGMPASYYADLPKLRGEPLAGLPRIYGIAWAFVAHSDSNFDPLLLTHFLQAYQEVDPLTLGELWALPTTLRVVLMENLSRLAEMVASNKAAREAANACCDHPDDFTEADLDALFDTLESRGTQVAFLAQLSQRLRGPLPGEPSRWLGWLDAHAPDTAAQLTAAHALQASNNVSVSHAVTALRSINNLDWTTLVATVSPVLQRLDQSPAFRASSELTRDQCTHAIERLARDTHETEPQIAELALRWSETDDDTRLRGPAEVLIGPGREAFARKLGSNKPRRGPTLRMRWALYSGAIVLGTVILMAATMAGSNLPPWAELLTVLLLAVPASEAVMAVVHRLISESAPVERLPRMGVEQGLQPEHRTLVVVPCMLDATESIAELAERLEQAWLSNPEQCTQFALLSDWLDAPSAQAPSDSALLQAARAAIDDLNARHPNHDAAPRFLLLHRARTWSEGETAFIGWERKRGKLEQLVAYLAASAPFPFLDQAAASRIAAGVAYVVTLDADTRMPPGTLRDLVSIAAHPLNTPRLDPATRRVVSGYGLLQPRVASPIPQPDLVTGFGWLMGSGHWGLDVYSSGSSEVYQDVFGEGNFTGKGLIHVRAFHAALEGRIPEDAVLSHDLFEGIWARCAHVSDVALLEPQPSHPDVESSRLHRWTRGDWQLLPFLGKALKGRVGALNLWKMLDNLRRSLLAPASVALLWWSLSVQAVAPGRTVALLLAAFGLGPLVGALASLMPQRTDVAWRHLLRESGFDVLRALLVTAWRFATLMQEALLRVDAIARALWRMAVSRKGLLQWTTAAQAEASTRGELAAVARRHMASCIAAVVWTALGLMQAGSHAGWLVSFGLLWLLTPLWVWLASQPLRRLKPAQPLAAADQAYLHSLARDTWRLFEITVTAEDHFLPPDNLQLEPRAMVARRSSPTNIGLYLLATMCAHRFGFIGTDEMVERLGRTIDSMEKLPRHRGHFHNWIDTQTLATLNPPYVSTVDSGNLAGHLWAVAQACREAAGGPAPLTQRQHALGAAVTRLKESSHAGLTALMKTLAVQPLLQQDLWALWQREPARLRTMLGAAQSELRLQSPEGEFGPPEWQPLVDLLRQLDSLLRDREVDRDRWPEALRGLARRADAISAAMDFSFLYDTRRRLFHIGYRPDEATLDASYYDLLASESRLTSYVAIAKGDVPRRHWTALGRPFISVDGEPTLRSWSGSMFEYLMPSLVMDEPHGGLLQRVMDAAVKAQQQFGESQGLPWGVSESAYFAQDHTLAFQYSPFGVPHLALRRTPPEDRVVAPYATVMATIVDASGAVANLKRLERMGARGVCGFIEALDFTKSRRGDEGQPQPVNTFMAHHQGMSLVALCELLNGHAVRHWFMHAPIAQSHAALLEERMPRQIVYQVGEVAARRLHVEDPASLSAVRVIDPATVATAVATAGNFAATQLLGNGNYAVSLRANGAGGSQWKGKAISRTRDDALREGYGTWLMLRRAGEVEFHSLTFAPNPRPDAHYRTRFFNDHVEFEANCDDWESVVSVVVSADDDVEFRRITLHNRAQTDVEFELLSCFEAVLAPQRADDSHPAFSNLFIQAHASDPRGVLLERRPRLATEQGVWAAHFLATSDIEPTAVRITCDRARVLPRLGDIMQIRPGPSQLPGPGGLIDTGLDPVASLAVRVMVPALSRVCLTFATAAAQDADTLLGVIDKYRQDVHLQRARLMSATLTRIRHRELHLDTVDVNAIQELTTLMLATPSRRRPLPEAALDRRALWRFGISGDRPIVLLRVNIMQGLPLVRTMLAAQHLWDNAGLICDLVIINGEPVSYLAPLQDHITAIRNSYGAVAGQNPPDKGGLHVLRSNDVSQGEIAALQAYARIDLLADGRPLGRLMAIALAGNKPVSIAAAVVDAPPAVPPRRPQRGATAEPWPDDLAPNRFSDDGHRYEMTIDSARVTPRPWANVLANADFGCIVTESGAGFSWARNSRLNQLTNWSNDALLDPPCEHFLAQDTVTREVFGLLPTLDRNGSAGWRVTHAQGESRFMQERSGIASDMRISVHPSESAKVVHLRLRNTGTQARSLRLIGMVEWVMGGQRSDRMTIATEFVPELQAVFARQLEHQGGFGDGTAFLMLAGPRAAEWTCARSEFFDALGRLRIPRMLGGASGLGLDPCGALDTTVEIAAGATLDCSWVLGYGDNREQAMDVARRLKARGLAATVGELSIKDWDQRLSAITVTSPDPLFDAMVNRWLLYQAVVCRLWAKAGFYQAGGATGFRDQLQDAMALVYAEPAALRAQIMLHASRQFPQGDVQHWWHSPNGAGVRTHFSDDLLWLPYATTHYTDVTGDRAILDDEAPFLEGGPVPDGQEDAYYVPTVSQQTATLYEHAARAIDRGLRFGEHGIPLMGTGDWNDGMNRIGHEGKGESVWLGWFLLVILRDWLPLAASRGDRHRVDSWTTARDALTTAMHENGWDGEWYRRAYFDNGHPLGSRLNTECQIDLIAQAWAVFASPPGDEHALTAMASADARLVDRRVGVIRLLDPPLQHQADSAGYIQAYPPGVRENGGQYSHAAVWGLMAQAQIGRADLAWEYFGMLSPAHRTRSPAAQRRYRIEPYVMAGDTYSQAPYEGRGGWSWYTGSASWLYRASIESILGLTLRENRLCFMPCLPPEWPKVDLSLRLRGKTLKVTLRAVGPHAPAGSAEVAVSVNARALAVGEWIDVDSLPDGSMLVVEVATAAPTPPRSVAPSTAEITVA